MTDPALPTIVGVDGSGAATAAVRWAARRAASSGTALRLLHAYSTPLMVPALPFGALTPRAQEAYAEAGRAVLAEAVETARAEAGGVEVSTALVAEVPAYALIEASASAQLVVVGSHGHSALAEVLLGSVGAQVSAHAKCPTAVIRGRSGRSAGPIVVGVDGSAAAAAALRFALGEADRQRLAVLAVCAWALPQPTGVGEAFAAALASGYELEEYAASARRTLAAAVRPLRAEFPDVEVHEQVVEKGPAAALVEASEGAAAVVVGSRGHGGFVGLLLGSTSQHVLHHAACPVVVTHAPPG